MLLFEYKGKQMTISELAKIAGIPSSKLYYNLSVCKTVEDAMSYDNVKKYEYEGKKYSIPELAALAGVCYSTMFERLKKYPVAQAVEMERNYKSTMSEEEKQQHIKENKKRWYDANNEKLLEKLRDKRLQNKILMYKQFLEEHGFKVEKDDNDGGKAAV